MLNNLVNPHYSVTFHSYSGDNWPELVYCILKYYLENQLYKDVAVYLKFYIIHPQERVLNLDLLTVNDE